MIQIRKNVFETNSSSTHSIAIPKKHADRYPNSITFNIGEYGWGFYEEDPASYLYTAILDYYCGKVEEREEKLDRLKAALDKYSINYSFQDPVFRKWAKDSPYASLENGYIDHSGELGEFLDAVFKDDETLLDFVFYGLVFTGNDNCTDDEYDFVHRNKPIIYDYSDKEENPNPYYTDEYENYDWYMKGN